MALILEDAPAALDTRRSCVLEQTRSHRENAEALLRSLRSAKDECEKHLTRFKRADAYKSFTGRSAMDNAIAATQRMLDSIDQVIHQTAGDRSSRSGA